MPSHTITIGWRSAAGASLSLPVSITDTAESSLDIVVNNAVTNQLATLAIVRAKTSVLVLSSNADLTVKTNSSSSPADTITLLAGIPRVWYTGSGYTIFLTADVTAVYLTNASGQQATLKIRILYNP